MDFFVHITDYDAANYKVLKDSKSATTDLYLSYCGIERCTPSYRYADDPRMDYLIHFILDGKGILCLDGNTHHLQEGQAFMISPGTNKYSYTADVDRPWTYMWIGFNGKQALTYLKHTGFSSDHPVHTVHNMEAVYHVMQLLLKTKALTLSNDIRRDACLYKILSLLIVSYQSSQTGSITHDYPSQTYAIYAKNYIDDNFSHTNITEIAKLIGIDRSYLHNVFRKNFQLSPQEYLIRCRLNHAKKLLSATTLTIRQIAQQSGYEDSLQFSKIFKKHCGQSPRAYRSSNCGKGEL